MTWDPRGALLGLLLAVPALVLVPVDTQLALALAVGVLPAALIGLPRPGQGPLATVVLGVLCGAGILIGSLLAQWPVLAVLVLFGLCVVAALAATDERHGTVLLGLCLPMVGIGFSYAGLSASWPVAALMVAGSVYAGSLLVVWRIVEGAASEALAASVTAPGGPMASRRWRVGYGVRLGLAATSAAALGFVLALDHVGWACAAVLLVMRPNPDLVWSRAVGRLSAVLVGAFLAVMVVGFGEGAWLVGVGIVVAVSGMAATTGSRWYVTPAFTTFLVFLLLLYSRPEDSTWRFLERTAETALGVLLALVFGLLVPLMTGGARRAEGAPAG